MTDGIVLGVGCERGIDPEHFEEGISRVLDEHGYDASDVVAVATIDLKRDEQAITRWARDWEIPIRFFSAKQLRAVPSIPSPSAVVEECVGTPGVAEPAALLVGDAEELLVDKTIVEPGARAMTVAVAPMIKVND